MFIAKSTDSYGAKRWGTTTKYRTREGSGAVGYGFIACRTCVYLFSVDREGNPLLPPKDNLLESLEGTLSLPLNERNSTSFSLKVLDTSEGDVFRLLFTVDYTMERIGTRREKILSRPFTVNSNRRKSMKGTDIRKLFFSLQFVFLQMFLE